MKWVAKWSKKPRKRAVVTIFASGLTAASFSKKLEKLMLEKTDAHKSGNLGACPDQYGLQPHGSGARGTDSREEKSEGNRQSDESEAVDCSGSFVAEAVGWRIEWAGHGRSPSSMVVTVQCAWPPIHPAAPRYGALPVTVTRPFPRSTV